jgi:hypothetical protein
MQSTLNNGCNVRVKPCTSCTFRRQRRRIAALGRRRWNGNSEPCGRLRGGAIGELDGGGSGGVGGGEEEEEEEEEEGGRGHIRVSAWAVMMERQGCAGRGDDSRDCTAPHSVPDRGG